MIQLVAVLWCFQACGRGPCLGWHMEAQKCGLTHEQCEEKMKEAEPGFSMCWQAPYEDTSYATR